MGIQHKRKELRTANKRRRKKLKHKLRVDRRRSLDFTMRETNVAGCNFLKSQGVRATGVSRAAYYDTGEDAIEMRYALPQDAQPFPAGLSRLSEAEKGTW